MHSWCLERVGGRFLPQLQEVRANGKTRNHLSGCQVAAHPGVSPPRGLWGALPHGPGSLPLGREDRLATRFERAIAMHIQVRGRPIDPQVLGHLRGMRRAIHRRGHHQP